MAGGGGNGSPSWLEPRQRMDLGRRLGRALGWPRAGATGPGADCRGAPCVSCAGGRRSGVGRGAGPLLDAGVVGRTVRRCRACLPVGPPAQGHLRTGRACRAGALVFHDVDRARCRLDAGAGFCSPMCRGGFGCGFHRIGTSGAGTGGGGNPHCGHARHYRCGGGRSLLGVWRRHPLGRGPKAYAAFSAALTGSHFAVCYVFDSCQSSYLLGPKAICA